MPLGIYDRSTAKPVGRPYSDDLISTVAEMYRADLSLKSIAHALGFSIRKVGHILDAAGVARRRTGPISPPTGPANGNWKPKVGYHGMHARLIRERGKPQHCTTCGATSDDRMYEWANLTGQYEDPDDYARMCRSCHRLYDNARRRETGANTIPLHMDPRDHS